MTQTSSNAAFAAKSAILLSKLNALSDPLSVRLQSSEDLPWVTQLHGLAFGPGRLSRAAFIVRENIKTDPNLCLIAQIGDERVGSVWMTPIELNNDQGFLLGPVATDPKMRNKGAGRLLVKTVCKLALEKCAESFVLLVGDLAYYEPMGFARVRANNIVFPGPVDPKRVLVSSNRLTHAKELAGTIAGR